MKQKRQALLLICHPNPDSFCHALAHEAESEAKSLGLQTKSIDLYRDGFDPVLPMEDLLRKTSFDPGIQEHENLVRESSDLLFFYPDWWGQTPALLKGWLDRVFRPGTAYDYLGPDGGPKQPVGLFTEKKAWIFVTRDSKFPDEKPLSPLNLKKQSSISQELGKTSHDLIWRDSISGFTGIKIAHLVVMGPMYKSRMSQRQKWLADCRGAVTAADEIV